MTARYPVYVPSKQRAEYARVKTPPLTMPFTAALLHKSSVPFHLVVEPQDVDRYAREWERYLLVLPDNDRGLVFARNWIKEHAASSGAERHWQFDDDIRYLRRVTGGYRTRVAFDSVGAVLRIIEDFVDRYQNIALASMNSAFFIATENGISKVAYPPYYLNFRCYTNFLMLNSLPNKWRFRYNEDTDMTLQVLADGWCTVLFNAFCIETPETLTAKGGQMGVYRDDGRLKMARDLERVWPGVVTTYRRFGRPQHRVNWKLFDTPLKRKASVNFDELKPNDSLKLRAVSDVRSPRLRALLGDETQKRSIAPIRRKTRDALAVVQFIHPGKEQTKIANGRCDWNSAVRSDKAWPHRRKFIAARGSYEDRGRDHDGTVGFWGEWEGPSFARPISRSGDGEPQFCHTIALHESDSYDGLLDTDPFVFGDHFLYNGCQQHTAHHRPGGATETFLRRLARGSMILFGSSVDKAFVLDTVLIVGDFTDYKRGDFDALRGLVPDEYYPIALCPQATGNPTVSDFRLYRGATKAEAIDEMFSFTPCRPLRKDVGFARPNIVLPGIVTQHLSQGKKMTRMDDIDGVREVWIKVRDQIAAAGLALGHHIELAPVSYFQKEESCSRTRAV